MNKKQIERGLEYYRNHTSFVKKLFKEATQGYEPSEVEDKNDPRLWKSNHWKWFVDTQVLKK